jgi:hypothetical protein
MHWLKKRLQIPPIIWRAALFVLVAFVLLQSVMTPIQTPVAAFDVQQISYTPIPTLDWMPPPLQVPVSIRPEDHFWLTRPIASNHIFYPHPYYRYGNTYFGKMTVHSGVDLQAETGTPVRAAGNGEVIWASWGLYNEKLGKNDPYGLSIAIQHDFGYHGQPIYTIYAHLSQTTVEAGQQVTAGEIIALSGNTGNSTGPHLHFEVRIGKNSFYTSRNPELWLAPLSGHGVLTGRVLDAEGVYINQLRFNITNLDIDRTWAMWSYSDRVAKRDNDYAENFVLSDLPTGNYRIRSEIEHVTYTADVKVLAGQSTFVILQAGGKQDVGIAEPKATNGPVAAP